MWIAEDSNHSHRQRCTFTALVAGRTDIGGVADGSMYSLLTCVDGSSHIRYRGALYSTLECDDTISRDLHFLCKKSVAS